MDKIKISYGKIKNKITKFIVIWSLILISLIAIIIFLPFMSEIKYVLFSFMSVALGATLLWQVRRIGNEAKCNNCNTALYSEIHSLKEKKRTLSYCPVCGREIEIEMI